MIAHRQPIDLLTAIRDSPVDYQLAIADVIRVVQVKFSQPTDAGRTLHHLGKSQFSRRVRPIGIAPECERIDACGKAMTKQTVPLAPYRF